MPRATRKPSPIAEWFKAQGFTPAELVAYIRKEAGTERRNFTCPRCGIGVETEVNKYDHSATCPACKNIIFLP